MKIIGDSFSTAYVRFDICTLLGAKRGTSDTSTKFSS